MKKKVFFLSVVLYLFGSMSAYAIEEGSAVGFGFMYYDGPYDGVDSQAYAVPLAVVEHKKIFIDGMTLGYYLNSVEGRSRIGIIAAPRFMGYHSSDSTALAGMEDRESAFDVGLRFTLKNDFFTTTCDLVADVSGTYNGQESRVVLSREFLGGFLTPRVGLRWQSSDLVDYYYGVTSIEATPSRSQYAPSSEFECIAGLRMGIPLNDDWVLISDVQFTFLGDKVQNSPIVSEDFTPRYLVGLIYRF